jgi:hypothetical protein
VIPTQIDQLAGDGRAQGHARQNRRAIGTAVDEVAQVDHHRLRHGPRVVILSDLVEHGRMSGDAAMDVADRVDAQITRQTAWRWLESELHLGGRAIMPST